MGLRDPVVCIVGAGPAGLVTAHLLWRAGISFVVLERQEADGLCARVKAGLIEHRTVELLGPYGLADPILERGWAELEQRLAAAGQPAIGRGERAPPTAPAAGTSPTGCAAPGWTSSSATRSSPAGSPAPTLESTINQGDQRRPEGISFARGSRRC